METDKASPALSFCCFLSSRVPSVPQVHVLAMIPADVPLSHLGRSVLLLLQLLLPPASAFFPNIWSLLAAPGSITHQDLTEEAALNVTLHLFLEQPPPGRPPLHLEDFLVSVPGFSHIPARFPHSRDLCYLRVLLAKTRDPHTHSLLSSRQQQCPGVLVLQSGVPLHTDIQDCPSLVGPSTLSSFHIQP